MIEKEDIERLRDIFVTRKECDEDMSTLRQQNASIETKLALIEDKVNTITWVAKTTLAAVIGFVVVYIATLLFK